MPINSKQKGAAFERTVALMFRENGIINAHRTAQFSGKTGQAADVEGIPLVHVEAKAQEKMRLYDWMNQSIRDSEAEGKGNLPIVVHKANRKDVLVTMRFDDWMKLYKIYLDYNITEVQ